MPVLEDVLGRIALAQSRRPHLFIAIAVAFTILTAFGLPNIYLEGDINKQMPKDLPAMELQEKVNNRFGGSDTIFIAIQLDKDINAESPITDIRDPRVLRYVLELDQSFSEETVIGEVVSPALVFKVTGVPDTLDQVKAIMDASPQAGRFFSDDKTLTLMFLSADIGSNPERIRSVTNKLQDILDKASEPAGVKTSITGSPQIIVTLVRLLESDAATTLISAIAVVFVILVLLARAQGVLIVIPLVLGVIWMFGSLGWLNIPLSFATAGVGAVIVGLGVEYGVFYIKRFYEGIEEGMDAEAAVQNAVPKVGSAMIGSSATTILGFLALTLASTPMLQNLGFTLALGIFYSLVAALIINPPIGLCVEKTCFVKLRKLLPGRKDDSGTG
ncbi:MAG: MMPL family transporter [Candidatus Altiarchaeota archaeon]|nr:MMPL family transporter [Candidatus Altiarchaeota archaeon]